jgi:hypothetical protein
MLLEGAAEAGRAVIEQCLVGVVGGHRGHEVRVHHPALHRVQPPVAEVVPQPVGVEEMTGAAEPGGPQHLLAAGALMAEIMDGVADPLVRHGPGVLLRQQDRDEPGLPVVAVNDIGTLTGPGHELQRRLGEEREPLRVVSVPVQALPAEEAGGRVRLDEIAFPAVRVAEPHRAADRPAVPRHPQVVVARPQVPDLRLPHAGVLGQDDLDRVPPEFQFPAETGHHIAEPARLGRRCALGRHHHDIHHSPTARCA